MRSSRALAVSLLLLAPAAGAAPPSVETLERVLAVVDGRPLLLSEVSAVRAVRGLGEVAALEAAIDERLMYLEAARLGPADVPPEEEDGALTLLLGTRAEAAAGVPEPDLRRLLRRQIAIVRYVEFRFRPQVRVSDQEVRRAWEQEQAGRPAGPALEDAAEAIRERLERRALDERIEAWVRELRARAEVRYVTPPPAGGP
jgi:hypothetical protein